MVVGGDSRNEAPVGTAPEEQAVQKHLVAPLHQKKVPAAYIAAVVVPEEEGIGRGRPVVVDPELGPDLDLDRPAQPTPERRPDCLQT